MNYWNGGWSWSSLWSKRRYVIEIPCESGLVSPTNNAFIASSNEQAEKVFLESIYPNPSRSVINVGIQGTTDLTTNLQIFNTQGQQVLNKLINITEGEQTIEVDISALPEGIYHLLLPTGNGQEKGKRFMKIAE